MIKKIALLVAVVLIVGASAGLIFSKRSESGSVSVTHAGSVAAEPEGIYLVSPATPPVDFKLYLNGEEIPYDDFSDYLIAGHCGISGSDTRYGDLFVLLLPSDGFTLVFDPEHDWYPRPEESKAEEQRSGPSRDIVYLTYADGTKTDYTIRTSDEEPLEIQVGSDVRCVVVTEYNP